MAAESDLVDTIAETAQGPAEVVVDGQDVTAQSLRDLIAADKYLKEQAALAGNSAQGGSRSAWGIGVLRTARVVPPGAS